MAQGRHTDQFIAAAWARVQLAAEKGERCPQNYSEGITTEAMASLAKDGFVRILISGANWRTVHILKGPQSGKSTMPDPKGDRVYKIIGTHGAQMIPKPPRQRGTPSKPQLLTDPRNSDVNPRGASG